MKKQFLLLALLIFSFTFVLAEPNPPFQQGSNDRGIVIEAVVFSTLEQGQNFTQNAHAFNSTTKKAIPNTELSGYIHLYNSKGEHILVANLTQLGTYDMTVLIEGSNFLKSGFYAMLIYLEANGEGDFFEYTFRVTPSGDSGTNNIIFYVIILVLGYTLNLLGFFNRNATITILGGIVLVFVGLFMLQNGIIIYRDNLTLALSYVTLFWGAGSALWAAIEEIQDNM